jgi:putative component of membrane protein insertase Oxa1/YidC/SpoIIIJ protein YidD
VDFLPDRFVEVIQAKNHDLGMPRTFGNTIMDTKGIELAEQEEAQKYVLEKEMIRPETNILTVIKYYLIFLSSTLGVTVTVYFLLRFPFPVLAAKIQRIAREQPWKTGGIIFIVCHVTGFLIVLKSIIIGFVHLYQRYAPEEVRRNCLFKPTCSEYMVLALQKYGLFKGLAKSFDRFKRCHGNTYHIDYP